MTLPHRIPLRGPWEYEPVVLSSGEHAAAEVAHGRPFLKAARAHFPAGWDVLFGNSCGCARFRRRFHRPTNLDPDERVILEIAAVGGVGKLTVNGVELGTVRHSREPQRYDVTDVLTGNDELIIELQWNGETTLSDRGGLYAPIVLEIVQGTTSIP